MGSKVRSSKLIRKVVFCIMTIKKERQDPMISILLKKPFLAFFNILRVSLERRFRMVKIQGLPFQLFYEPTTYCILKCPSCPTGLGIIDRSKEKVSVEHFKATIDAFADYVFEIAMFNWGEPLLHNDLAELIRYATDKGIIVHISSNLSMQLDKEQCYDIVNSGLYRLLICIDGATSKTHAFYRRGSNLEIVHRNLQNLVGIRKKSGKAIPIIDAMYLMFAHNESEFEEFQKQMIEFGVDSATGVPPMIPLKGEVMKSNDPLYDFCAQTNKTILEMRLQESKLRPCSWLYYSSVINPNGTISPCCGILSEKNDFGRIYATNEFGEILNHFRDEWNGYKYTAARKLFSNKNAVKKWASKNLNDISPDGMTLSTNKECTGVICSTCPIPWTLRNPSGFVGTLFVLFAKESIRCMKALDFRSAAVNTAKTLILMLAFALQ
jgi:MoaA/NifB/PqqE/SkfB family radical SAM enzyme